MRWPTVEESRKGDALFDADALAERHVGRGEFAGMEFLHVNAKRIISEVPKASHMSFRYTINAYRGCSHACTYCLSGETPILLADGQTKPLEQVRTGDIVYGVERRGTCLHYIPTKVLDHWPTVKPAYRVTLADGTELVASADHRFLTPAGWKRVTGPSSHAGRRPQLTINDKLVGIGASGVPPDLDSAVNGTAHLDIVDIEPMDTEFPLYDITTDTGNFLANGVVSHNCFARPTHEYLGLGIGEDFERRIVVKVNAVERLRADIAARRWAGHHIAMGTNTDPYQRCEGKYHLTQGIIGVLSAASNPFSILTKSTLVLRDLDVLAKAARRCEIKVNLSIGTLDDDVWRLTEPGTPRPRARIEAVRRLNAAGVPCGVLVAPVIPGLSDDDRQLSEVVAACVDAGAVSISTVALHLRPGVREHYLSWLRKARPDLAQETERRYQRSYLPAAEQNALTGRVRQLVESAQGKMTPPSASVADRVRVHMGGDRRPETPRPEPVEQLVLDLR